MVREGLAVLDADRPPYGFGQGLGRDHERVQRQHASAGGSQRRAVALGGDHQPVAAHRAGGGDNGVRREVDHLGTFEDAHPSPLERSCESAHEFRGMDAGAVRIERRTERTGRRLGPEQVERVDPERGRLRDLGASGRELHGGAREGEGAALDVVDVESGGCRGTPHLVHGRDHRPPHRDRGIPTVLAFERRSRSGEERAHPAAVAPGRAESGDLLLEHHDGQRRVAFQEVPRRPQSGESAADDRDIGIQVAG